MIIGTITVYRCDGQDCEVCKVVTDENEHEFMHAWFAGLDKHFCPDCRGHILNAAAIADQERRLHAIETSVRSQLQTGKRRPHVH